VLTSTHSVTVSRRSLTA